jgi:DNA adenine methylase
VKAPFPYFGGKSRIASVIWERFGNVRNYVEPFFGSGAVLLLRPDGFTGTETINDADGMVANFWRATQADPDAVAHYADNPVNENDLHARHVWLVERKPEIQSKLEGDPEFYDPRIAGWWCWGLCCWIGSGWCSGRGPWQSIDVDGFRQLVHLGDAGRGVSRQRVHLNGGQGVNGQLVGNGIYQWFGELSQRLRRVRVCCGDWSRVCTKTPTLTMGETAVFLDPPYADTAKRTADLYTQDSLSVAHDVREWAIANGDRMRIALAGYEGEHEMPTGWETVCWKTIGGYGSQGSQGSLNASRERLWFSPRCERPEKPQRQAELAMEGAT